MFFLFCLCVFSFVICVIFCHIFLTGTFWDYSHFIGLNAINFINQLHCTRICLYRISFIISELVWFLSLETIALQNSCVEWSKQSFACYVRIGELACVLEWTCNLLSCLSIWYACFAYQVGILSSGIVISVSLLRVCVLYVVVDGIYAIFSMTGNFRFVIFHALCAWFLWCGFSFFIPH